MHNQNNESTSSLEHFVQKKEQQQIEQEHARVNEPQERLATKQDMQEILKRLDKLQMSVDRILDVM